jgi:glycosyltransferase involved in cell wall biosynthesis
VVVASESTDQHPPDAPRSRPAGLPEGVPYFLMVNPGEKRKNWQDVIDGFARYIQERPEDRSILAFVGGFNEQGPLVEARLARDPALERRVINLHYVTDAELRYLYANAQASLYLSVYEGFGIPVLESLGLGTPVVVSDVPIFHEVAGDAGVFVPLGAPDKVAEALKRLVLDADFRASRVERGLRHAATFSWRRSAGTLLEALVRLGRDGRLAAVGRSGGRNETVG